MGVEGIQTFSGGALHLAGLDPGQCYQSSIFFPVVAHMAGSQKFSPLIHSGTSRHLKH